MTTEVEDSSCFDEEVPAMVAKVEDGPKDDYSRSIQTIERLCSLIQAFREQNTPSNQIPWLSEAMATLSLYLGATFCEAFRHTSISDIP